jgi:hypothetical protein
VRRRRVLLLTILLVGAIVCCEGLREDELLCEEAAAHLQSCCPGFDVTSLSCSYTSGCGSTTYPALSIAASQCINGESCAALVSGNVCQRAQQAKSVVETEASTGTGSTGDEEFAEVCP